MLSQTEFHVYRQILEDHAEICELATTLFRVLVEQQQPPVRVAHLFEALCAQTKVHFEDEEASGMFEDIARSRPHLAAQTRLLQNEHHDLLRDLECLRDQACAGELTRSRWEELERGFRAFSNRLTQHEGHENALLERVSSSGGDCRV